MRVLVENVYKLILDINECDQKFKKERRSKEKYVNEFRFVFFFFEIERQRVKLIKSDFNRMIRMKEKSISFYLVSNDND